MILGLTGGLTVVIAAELTALVKIFTNSAELYLAPTGHRPGTVVPPRGPQTVPERCPDGRSEAGLLALCRATMPPDKLRHATSCHPAAVIRRAIPAWSGHAWIDSAR